MAALLVLTLCMSVFAVTAIAEQYVKIKGDCNLRTGPGLGYSVRTSVPAGKKLTYLGSRKKDGRDVTWYKVKYNGKTGWVSSRLSSLSSSGGSSSSGKVKTTGSVYIRSSASRSGKILGSVKAGTKLTYRGKSSKDSRGVRWYAVKFNGQNGWVSSRYSYLM